MFTWKTLKIFSYNALTFKQLEKCSHSQLSVAHCSANATSKPQEIEFTPLELYPSSKQQRHARKKGASGQQTEETIAPRANSMNPDQDWPSVWPAARTFHPASVPLPVRMGFPTRNQPTPDKWANAELMKIPNFLHLTPPAVERHCAAMKKFCSPWPQGVTYSKTLLSNTRQTDAKKVRSKNQRVSVASPSAEEAAQDPGYFPMITTKSSFLFSGPFIRDPRARLATIKVRLEDLLLGERGQDKLLRLVGERFDRISNTITITADRCPLHQQNLQYCHYLLTVLRIEAESTELWEQDKERLDMQLFEYSGSSSEMALLELQKKQQQDGTVPVLGQQQEEAYQAALLELLNNGEADKSLCSYSESVLRVLGIQERLHDDCSSHNSLLDEELPPITIKSYFDHSKVFMQDHSWEKRLTPY